MSRILPWLVFVLALVPVHAEARAHRHAAVPQATPAVRFPTLDKLIRKFSEEAKRAQLVAARF